MSKDISKIEKEVVFFISDAESAKTGVLDPRIEIHMQIYKKILEEVDAWGMELATLNFKKERVVALHGFNHIYTFTAHTPIALKSGSSSSNS